MLRIVGFIFLCLGLLTGIALILGPVGLWSVHASVTMYVLFALLTAAGYLLFAMSSKNRTLPALGRITGTLLALLSIGAAVALVLVGLGITSAASGTLPLWYVLVIAGLASAAMLSAHEPVAAQ